MRTVASLALTVGLLAGVNAHATATVATNVGVAGPSGVNLPQGGTVYLGLVGNGYSSTQTFTITNKGQVTLNITGVGSSGGTAPDDFSVGTPGSLSLAPGDKTTFDVTVSPTALGVRTTILQIVSDDVGYPTFSLPLNVTSVAESTMSLAGTIYSVNQGATSVVLTVTRTVASNAQTVHITTADGATTTFPPFSAALAGIDYVVPSTSAGTVSFGVGQYSKTVAIALIRKTGSVPNKQFTVSLSSPSAGAALGTQSTATIKILANTTAKPSLTVDSPAMGTTTLPEDLNPTVTVTGTADDARGISSVTVIANGKNKAATFLEPTGTAVPYTFTFTPVLGLNTLSVIATDLRGNSTTVPRNFTLTGGVNLTITRSVPSAISTKPDLAGFVTAVGSPTSSVGALTPGTANANPKVCLAVPSNTVTLTAAANIGYAFSHWSTIPDGATAVGNVLSFTMPGTPTAATAVFVAAPFNGATGTSSSFYGLLAPVAGTAPSTATVGSAYCGISPTNGSFSGTVRINGRATNFTGTFFGDGSCVFTVNGASSTSLPIGDGTTLTLVYNAGAGNNIVTATITAADGQTQISTGSIKRSYYSATRPVPSNLLNAATAGSFTFAVPAQDQGGADPTTYPQGDGFGTLTLNKSGTVSIGGTLADGTTFTASSALVDTHTCPFFAQVTTAGGATTLGAITGTLTFDPTQNSSDVTATNVQWFRASAGSGLYAAGWPAGINVGLVGALYNSTHTAQTSLGLGSANLTTGNAQLVFASDKLTSTTTVTAFNITGSTVKLIGTPGIALSFGLSGSFTGTFTPNWLSPLVPSPLNPTFQGILVEKGLQKGGFGFFISNAKGDTAPESGGVTLSAPVTN